MLHHISCFLPRTISAAGIVIITAVLLAGCDDGGPPPPMVLRDDPQGEPSDNADVVPVIGDSGGDVIETDLGPVSVGPPPPTDPGASPPNGSSDDVIQITGDSSTPDNSDVVPVTGDLSQPEAPPPKETKTASNNPPPPKSGPGAAPASPQSGFCWIDAKTGERVPTYPAALSFDDVRDAKNNEALGTPGRAHSTANGQNFNQQPNGNWIDSQTGQSVPTLPGGLGRDDMFAVKNGGNPNQTHSAATGQNFVRVPCPPPNALQNQTALTTGVPLQPQSQSAPITFGGANDSGPTVYFGRDGEPTVLLPDDRPAADDGRLRDGPPMPAGPQFPPVGGPMPGGSPMR